jgi:hypothetical protein
MPTDYKSVSYFGMFVHFCISRICHFFNLDAMYCGRHAGVSKYGILFIFMTCYVSVHACYEQRTMAIRMKITQMSLKENAARNFPSLSFEIAHRNARK